jgi:UDP-N-acetylglucosamine--N-acetylmuramyl-(pentapeptide) pyrophosphoryl-undecaprenol N-acetylglucosamine transferase
VSRNQKILVVTGSSGGHIFPALSFIDALKDKEKNIDVLLVLPKKSVRDDNLAQFYRIKYISVSKIAPSLGLGNIFAVFNFLKGCFESLFLMVEFRPDVTVGFGSLNSIPVILCAWLFRIKTVLHEQNVIPGRATRFLSKCADLIAVSFNETRKYLSVDQNTIIVTGNPVRKETRLIERARALKFFNLGQDRFTVLVVGGSQGSHRINTCFSESLSLMPESVRPQVIHITGIKDFDRMAERYQDLDVKVELFAFLKEMQYAYSAADLVIARSGATTIAELVLFKLAAVLVPYPYAYAHQYANARFLENIGASIVIKDDDLDGNKLKNLIFDLMNNRQRRELMRSGYSKIPVTNAAELLAEEVIKKEE